MLPIWFRSSDCEDDETKQDDILQDEGHEVDFLAWALNTYLNEDVIPEKSIAIIPEIVDGIPEETNSGSKDITIARENIRNGLVSLNNALFEQVIRESSRLPIVRDLVYKVEDHLMKEQDLDLLTPDQKLKLYNLARRAQDSSLSFLQGMYRMSIDVLEILDVYQKVDDENIRNRKDPKIIDPKVVDHRKVHMAKQLLLKHLRDTKKS